MPHAGEDRGATGEGWKRVQLGVSMVLVLALGAGLFQYLSAAKNLPIAGWQRTALGGLLLGACLVFAVRIFVARRQ